MFDAFTEQLYQRLKALLDNIWIIREQDPTYELLSPQEELAMDIIGRQSKISMSELAKALGMFPNTLTGIVDRLVRRKIAQRKHSPKDRRVVLVQLTEEGRRLNRAHQKFVLEQIDRVVSPLNETDRDKLIQLLERIIAKIAI